jgi:hypothetical protein
MDELIAEIAQLKQQNALLTEQLEFSRQKASLYYIAKSELEILKRSAAPVNQLMVSVAADTSDLLDCSKIATQTGSQTEDNIPDMLISQMEKTALESEIASLKALTSLTERTEKARTQFMQRIDAVVSMGEISGLLQDSVIKGYSELFEEYLKLNSLSINHSVEIKKRDEMIGSLLDKIKMMERTFSRRILQAERLADSRKQVIEELGEQVKTAMRVQDTSVRGNGELEGELEDLRAELSMARSNWAATRDELFRIQFRVGEVGVGQEYPPPIISLIDAQTQRDGILSMIREIRDVSSRI